MISFDEFLKQDEADKYNMLQECNAIIQQKEKTIVQKDKVVNDLLKRISNLEFEVEKLETKISKAIKYCEDSSMTLKSHYFIDVITLLKGDN